MRKRTQLREKLSYANVAATLALFVALGGGAVAASNLGKNSVGTKQLKKNAVTKVKIKKNAVNGPKVKNKSLTGADINLDKLGTVPSAQNAITANTANTATVASTANSLGPSEGWHEVGTAGEPVFLNEWHNRTTPTFFQTVAFYKDQEGLVHLRGDAQGPGNAGEMFDLPPGYRPATGKSYDAPGICFGGPCDGVGLIAIAGTDVQSSEDGAVYAPFESTIVSLNGITFRAES